MIVAILLIHVLLGVVLVRAMGRARVLADQVGLGPVLVAMAPAAPTPPPQSKAAASHAHEHAHEGASGAAGKRASAEQIVAPPPLIPIPAMTAAPVAGTGSESRSGASAAGAGTGGSNAGAGTGSGSAGNGSGGRYAVTKPVKIAGELVEADYPKAGRAKRMDTAAIFLMTVATDGHVSDCEVQQPSGDPEADAVTCRVAKERFRFTPAVDQNGDPVVAKYGWQQRFFRQAPGQHR